MPAVAGNEPFNLDVDLMNGGRVEATVGMRVTGSDGNVIAEQTLNIPPRERIPLRNNLQIGRDETFTFTFSGDLEQTVTKTVQYGLGTSLQLGDGSGNVGIFSEGKISVPVTVTNTGQLAESIEANFQLVRQSSVANQQLNTYYIPSGGNITDWLSFDLTEGDYQLSASSQLPNASAQATFSVRKENKAGLTATVGAQTDEVLPVTVNLANLG